MQVSHQSRIYKVWFDKNNIQFLFIEILCASFFLKQTDGLLIDRWLQLLAGDCDYLHYVCMN